MLGSRRRAAAPPPRAALVDAHVHYYSHFGWESFLDAASTNFARAAARAGLDRATPGCLLLAEAAGCRAFDELAARAGEVGDGRWRGHRRDEQQSLLWVRARPAGAAPLLVIAGRQIVSREGLEVLALCTRHQFEDGQPLRDVIWLVREAGALPVIPWGFGKWWLARGRLLHGLLHDPVLKGVHLGDNGGRLRYGPAPHAFHIAAAQGRLILPGSDPLPLSGEAGRAGSYGFILRRVLDLDRPAESLRAAIGTLDAQPERFGRRVGLARFCSLQAGIHLRNRRAKQSRGRTLVIAPQPFYSPRGTPLSVYYRTRAMALRGMTIDLLTYGEGADVDIPGVRLVRIPRLAFLGPVKVGPSPAKAFLDLWLILWTLGLMLRRRYDVVHAHEEAVFWCRFLKPIFRFRLIYDMHSSLPQQLTNFRFTKSRLLIGLFTALERTCLRSADAVITICPELRDIALREGADPARHILIENSLFDEVRLKAAPAEATPPRNAVAHNGGADGPGPRASASRARETSALPSGPRVVYAGTFEPYQGIDLLIEAFARVVRARPDARLILAGGTDGQVAAVHDQAARLGLNGQCLLTGRVPRERAVELVCEADVLVSPRRHGANTPLKIYEQLASGRPLIATRIGAHTQVLDEQTAFLVDPTPEAMAEGILAALNDETRRTRTVERAQRLYREKYSREAYDRKIDRLLEVIG